VGGGEGSVGNEGGKLDGQLSGQRGGELYKKNVSGIYKQAVYRHSP
jgi:hypothetical protein